MSVNAGAAEGGVSGHGPAARAAAVLGRVGARPNTPRAGHSSLLLLIVAVPMAVAALLELRSSATAAVASVLAGAAEAGWIAVELGVMQKYNVLQPVMPGLGLMVILLALWAYRTVPLWSRRRR